MSYVVSQFGNPRGLMGWLVGWAMAHKNRERNVWTLQALDVGPADHVLEIGCGPGVALAAVAETVKSGYAVGIDRSVLMVRQASRRNQSAIHAGRAHIMSSNSEHLPFPAGYFDKAFASNVSMFWSDPQQHLAEIRRVLKPGGLLVLSLQPRWAKRESEVQAIGHALKNEVKRAGFGDLHLDFHSMAPVTALRVRGRKALSGNGV
ncbi:MAG: class I SAM-dependent methyltransferase [Burkholderiales bacterium]